ncbi:TetR/AcrR family transcriptional regulator C-terminal domain-containing protein [Dactylosporangium sp. NPDC049525]|uniref:TetR/AcrR family transcriptional regulator C-terminal domain-containing protein n=1 Tax=Dactylosporangium sp. NPDC049525 TaxID=3154730 RepID=UPI0034373334
MRTDSDGRPTRAPLSRDRVLQGALTVADAGGLESLTIRSLAQELGVKPMSVYYHVANKSEIIDGIVDLVYSEIELPALDGDWRTGMRRRAASARTVLRRHPWAIPLLQSRTKPGPATLRHHDAVIGSLRTAGFSVTMTAHAFALIDSYVFGFALSESALPINGPETVAEVATSMFPADFPDLYPHLIEFTTEHVLKPGYDFGAEFDFGLTIILNALSEPVPGGSTEPSSP